MQITRRQLRRLIAESYGRRGSMRDILPDDVMHEMRVIQIMNTLIAMKRNGHNNEELAKAIEEVQEKLKRGDVTPRGL